MSTGAPPSRAGSLPQLIFSVRKAGYFFRSAEHATLYASCWYLFSVPGKFEVVLLGLGIDGLRRQQRHLAILQQLEHPFDLERGRPTGELTFLAALLDRDAVDGVFTDERRNLRGEQLDVGRLVIIIIIIESDFLGVEGDVTQGRTVEDATAMIASLPLISMPQIFISIPFTAESSS